MLKLFGCATEHNTTWYSDSWSEGSFFTEWVLLCSNFTFTTMFIERMEILHYQNFEAERHVMCVERVYLSDLQCEELSGVSLSTVYVDFKRKFCGFCNYMWIELLNEFRRSTLSRKWKSYFFLLTVCITTRSRVTENNTKSNRCQV